MSRTPFSLAGYRALVHGLIGMGYSLRSFHAAEPDRPHLLLRHDVDQSIAIARELADLESANGWFSTWFVLVRTEMYNPFAREAVSDLRAMLAAGHEIGLHLDATHYDGDAALQSGCALECRMLEDMLGASIRLVSFHRPARDMIGRAERLAGRLHAYMPRFMQEMGYCSDSRGEWRHGHPFDHAAVRDRRALQLLTHAVWWVGPDAGSPRERLARALEGRVAALEAELAANNEVWR